MGWDCIGKGESGGMGLHREGRVWWDWTYRWEGTEDYLGRGRGSLVGRHCMLREGLHSYIIGKGESGGMGLHEEGDCIGSGKLFVHSPM